MNDQHVVGNVKKMYLFYLDFIINCVQIYLPTTIYYIVHTIYV